MYKLEVLVIRLHLMSVGRKDGSKLCNTDFFLMHPKKKSNLSNCLLIIISTRSNYSIELYSTFLLMLSSSSWKVFICAPISHWPLEKVNECARSASKWTPNQLKINLSRSSDPMVTITCTFVHRNHMTCIFRMRKSTSKLWVTVANCDLPRSSENWHVHSHI